MKEPQVYEPTLDESFRKLLIKVLIDSEDKGKFSPKIFFSKWFVDQGEAFYFLFKKNLKVTNIQFAELLALLKSYTKEKGNKDLHYNFQFLSLSEFETIIKEIIKSFPLDHKNKYNDIVKLYYSLLKRTIVIESYYGSCIVYIPPHLEIDLLSVCANSGYIHSCGHKLFSSKVYDTKIDDFFDELDNYLKKYCALNTKPIIFGIYTHDDFSEKSLNKDGINEVKIYVEKYYMGSNRLVSVLQKIKEASKFKNRLKVLDPIDTYTDIDEIDNVDTSKSIWLVTDKSIKMNLKCPGEDQYFICFERCLKNNNPFHIFNENKPAWIANTTIPHTLIGAMINITKPWWPKDNKINFLDPFVGTGTTLLEMFKYTKNRNISTECSDIEPIVRIIVEDNLDFFTLSPDKLVEFNSQLKSLKSDLTKVNDENLYQVSNSKFLNAYYWSLNLLIEQKMLKTEYLFTPIIIEDLEKKELFERILFYLVLRTFRKHIYAPVRGSYGGFLTKSYVKEASLLIRQIEELIRLKGKEISKKNQKDLINVFQGHRSYSCSINLNYLDKKCNIVSKPDIHDVRDLKENYYDIIITDPPYGYNTKEKNVELAGLYRDFIKSMVKALKNDGQLVICLPDKIHTGKQSPFFTHKELFIRQVLIAAEEQNREVINSIEKLPSPNRVFTCPYYWESKTALRRSILHFRFRDINKKIHA